jgi:hypothetical protein
VSNIILKVYRNRNRNRFINQIRVPGGHIQITIMIDTQQQYIKLNIRGEISIIVVQAHSDRKRDEREHIHIYQVIHHQSTRDTLSRC